MSPSGSPFPKTSDFLGDLVYPREKPLLEKIGCPPRTPPSRKSLLYIFLFYPLIQVYIDNKVVDADIKNKNNEVLGKGERERENRFYENRFPSRRKKVNPKKSARGRGDFTEIGFPLAVKIKAVKIKKENR